MHLRPVRFATLVLIACAPRTYAHDPISTKVTWDREISRLVFAKCTGCHRGGGPAFSLATYEEARPWAKAIKEETLERRMPPFGAVKGFGDLRDDSALSQEQIELISDWVEGGAPEGDPALLPKSDEIHPAASPESAARESISVTGKYVLPRPMTFSAIDSASLHPGASVRVVARQPDGQITPLIWIYHFVPQFARAYSFRTPLKFPAGTTILAAPSGAGEIHLVTSGSAR